MPNSISAQIQALERMGQRLDTAQILLDARQDELISFLACMPLPAWIKDLNSRMIYINPAYEQEYGINVEDYNSKLDSDVWLHESAAEVVQEYIDHDVQAINSRQYQSITEFYVDVAGLKHPISVLKWPLIVGGQVVAVAGLARIEI